MVVKSVSRVLDLAQLTGSRIDAQCRESDLRADLPPRIAASPDFYVYRFCAVSVCA